MIDIEKVKKGIEQVETAHKEAHINSKNEGDFDIWFEDYYDSIEQALNELETLKKPPMKVDLRISTNEPYTPLDKQYCPSCYERLSYESKYNYCPHCGVKLDWNDSE